MYTNHKQVQRTTSAVFCLAILLILLSFGCSATPVDKYYILIGQSNAYYMAEHSDLSTPTVNAHLINCGYRGQPIAYFRPSYNHDTAYGSCIKQALDAPKIDGIVFWQGESDTVSLALAKEWEFSATGVIQSLKSDLGSNIPIVMVIINGFPSTQWPYWLTVRASQCRFRTKNLALIDSSNYEFQPGNLHLTLAGYQAIGVDITKLFSN